MKRLSSSKGTAAKNELNQKVNSHQCEALYHGITQQTHMLELRAVN